MYRTKDQVASEFITEGKRRGITVRGIVICIATGIVESGLVVYANPKVPESEALPHDADGSDGFSVGPLQQQVVLGTNGYWWSDARTCMDPTLSAGLFYQRLAKLDYNNTANTPGSYAQAIQQSAYPTRYDQQMAAAQAIYNRLSGGTPVPATDPNRPNFNEYANYSTNTSSRGSTTVDLFLLHTEESASDNADGLAKFLISTQGGGNPVSYHYAVSQAADGGVTVVDCADTDQASWSVGNSNSRTINLCFAGSRAADTREQWLARSKAIDVAAYLAVQDAKKYGIPMKVLEPPYSAPGGVSDHRYCSLYLKDGNNHSDVGGPMVPPWTNFPWDVFEAAFTKYANQEVPVPTFPTLPTKPTPVGPADDQVTLRWNCLGGQTLVEALAEVRDKVLGTSDRTKTGVK